MLSLNINVMVLSLILSKSA